MRLAPGPRRKDRSGKIQKSNVFCTINAWRVFATCARALHEPRATWDACESHLTHLFHLINAFNCNVQTFAFVRTIGRRVIIISGSRQWRQMCVALAPDSLTWFRVLAIYVLMEIALGHRKPKLFVLTQKRKREKWNAQTATQSARAHVRFTWKWLRVSQRTSGENTSENSGRRRISFVNAIFVFLFRESGHRGTQLRPMRAPNVCWMSWVHCDIVDGKAHIHLVFSCV